MNEFDGIVHWFAEISFGGLVKLGLVLLVIANIIWGFALAIGAEEHIRGFAKSVDHLALCNKRFALYGFGGLFAVHFIAKFIVKCW